MRLRKPLMVSGGLHVAVLLASMVAFSAPRPLPPSQTIDHIPLEIFDESSDAPQMQGERDGQRQQEPQRREVANPTRDPEPAPTPPERPRPVEASSAPTPPPPPERSEPPPPPAPAAAAAPPVPTPPPPPQRPQQVARAEEPPDSEGLLRRIEEQRQQEERQRQEQQRQEQQRQEQQRREQQRAEQQRQEREQREARERQQREQREREQREARERQQREQRERQQREQREARERQRREQQQQQQAQQQFDAQRVRDLINRQQGAPQQQGVQGRETRTASLGNPNGSGRRLTQSDYARLIGLIRDQIAPCWSPPPAAGASPPLVRIELIMNRDGSLNGRPRVMDAGAGPNSRPFADSAVRAIVNCAQRQGGRLNLPAEMYDAPNGWREIEFAFDPSQLL